MLARFHIDEDKIKKNRKSYSILFIVTASISKILFNTEKIILLV